MVREDVRRFCRANGIRMSDSGSYYFELYGQRYRVSDHSIEESNRAAYDRRGCQRRRLYHPKGREDGVIYILSSDIEFVYLNLRNGNRVSSNGRVKR
jgi:hypothetical protein